MVLSLPESNLQSNVLFVFFFLCVCVAMVLQRGQSLEIYRIASSFIAVCFERHCGFNVAVSVSNHAVIPLIGKLMNPFLHVLLSVLRCIVAFKTCKHLYSCETGWKKSTESRLLLSPFVLKDIVVLMLQSVYPTMQ